MEKRNYNQQLVRIIDEKLAEKDDRPVKVTDLWIEMQRELSELSLATLSNNNGDAGYQAATKFILGHVHLYKLENGSVKMRPQLHRVCVSETLRILLRHNEYLIVCNVGAALGNASMSNDFKNNTYGKGIQSLRDFINDHQTLFTKIEPFLENPDNFMRQKVQIRDADIYLVPAQPIEVLESNLASNKLESSIDLKNSYSKTITNQQFIVDQHSIQLETGIFVGHVNDDDFSFFAEIIDHYLAEKLRFGELWERIKLPIGLNCSKKYLFEDAKWFIEYHPHLYEKKEEFVSKRSQEHRMILSELIEYMKTQKFICSKAEILSRVQQIAFDFLLLYENNFERFFNDHELLFEKFSSKNADMKKRGSTKTCLRLLNVYTIKERLKTVDYNSTTMAVGIVQNERTISTVIAQIESGEYAGQYIYCKMAELLPPCRAGITFQYGDKVSLVAVKLMHRQHQWQATSIAPYAMPAVTCSNSSPAPSKENGMTQLNGDRLFTRQMLIIIIAEQSKAIENNKATGDDRSLLPRRCILLVLEETRFRLVDSFLRDSGQTTDQLYQWFNELSIAITPKLFHTEYQLHTFIENRPHLFYVDMNQIIANTSDRFRSAMFDLLQICQDDQSMEALRLVISAKTSATHEALIEYAATKQDFLNFLHNHDKIFELSELLPNEDRILRTRGHCDAQKRLFLPRLYHKNERKRRKNVLTG